MATALTASIKQELAGTSEETPPASLGVPESVSFVDLEERILQLCSESPEGTISDDTISRDQPLIDTERRMKALQRLLSQGKIELMRSKQGHTLLYRLKTTALSPTAFGKGFEREERLVYQLIESSGNKGIWIRDIKNKSNLIQTQISKILKKLESKKLIKSVKSVQASKKKIYMLYDMTPDETLTGGAFYSDQEFESEFVDMLNHQCLKFLQQKAFKARATHSEPLAQASASLCSTQEVHSFITQLGISNVKLTVDNIRMILDTLIYDGRAEVQVTARLSQAGGDVQRLYRVAKPVLTDTGFNRIPCGICPVINHCCDGGAISPVTCIYMKDWLKF